jgi:hypothetical protein
VGAKTGFMYALAMFLLCMTSTCLIPLISKDTAITNMFTTSSAISSLA